jgi:type IV pilus assembly protein PilW
MSRRQQTGMTLVELMVAMVLGLVIVGGVIGVMLANKRSYSTNQGLSEVQETARTAFELMARDIRQAAGNGCDSPTRTSNVLKAGGNWWQDWWGMNGVNNGDADAVVAVGAGVGQRVAGTDTVHVQGLDGVAMTVESSDAVNAAITIDGDAPFGIGDIMLICDFDHAAIFQITDWDAGADKLTHDASGDAPGNCSKGLGFPAVCDGGSGNSYEFPENSQVGRLMAAVWYIGNNGRAADGGRSLFRRRLGPGGVEVTEEIVSGVTDMQVRYGENGSDDIQEADDVGTWDNVNSIFITLTADSISSNVTTNPTENQGRISRTFTYLITLRNRVT